MSANTSKEMLTKAAQTSKASTPGSTSSNVASTKATSATDGSTLRHRSAALDVDQASSQGSARPSRDTLLRGIGAWADHSGPNSGATTDSALGGDTSHRNTTDWIPNQGPEEKVTKGQLRWIDFTQRRDMTSHSGYWTAVNRSRSVLTRQEVFILPAYVGKL